MTKIPELDALVGKELGVSSWLHITQEMVNVFAKNTRDEQWIHVDVDRARQFMPDTGTIVHGYYTLSLLSALMKEAVRLPDSVTSRIRSIINYGIDKLRFTGKVPVSSRIRARVTLADAVATPKGVQITYSITVETEGQDRPALVSENLVLYVLG